MRLVHLRVPPDQREAVLDTLDDWGVDYLAPETTADDGTASVEFPLPVQAVDPVLDDLRAAGFDGGVVATSAETVDTPGYDELEERFVAGEETDDSVPAAEIRSRALAMNPSAKTYYAMTVLSVLVATVGLVRDSPAVVVGSMVISPQVGAALTASVGVALDDAAAAVRGLRSLIAGVVVAALFGAALGWLLRTTQVIPATLDVTTVAQISSRTSPGLLSVVVGVCAGAAGSFGLATDLPVSLVGVAVAAALVPAAAAVGIGLAWGYPVLAAGALVLLALNLAAVTLAGTGALWALGYRPDGWTGDGVARLGFPRPPTTLVLFVGLVTAGVLIGGFAAQQTAFDNAANEGVQAALDDGTYRELRLVSVRPAFTVPGVGDEPREVTVVVERPADRDYPALPARLREQVEAEAGTPVTVAVEFVDVRHAPPVRRDRTRRAAPAAGG